MSIDQAINLLATITLIEMMVTIGIGVTVAEVASVASNWNLLIRAAVANYILVPAAAVGLLMLFRANPMVSAGFLIAAVCPGAPYTPPFTRLARGNVAVAVGLMALLAGSSALMAPLLLRWLLPVVSASEGMQVNVGKMLGTLIGAQLLPLCVGLAIRHWRPQIAGKLTKPLGMLSTLLNLVTLGAIIAAQYRMLAEIRMIGYLGMLALVVASLVAGWVLGGSNSENRTAMAMATSVRNVGVSMVIATGSFAGTPAVTAATAFAVFQTVVIAILAVGWGALASRKLDAPIRSTV